MRPVFPRRGLPIAALAAAALLANCASDAPTRSEIEAARVAAEAAEIAARSPPRIRLNQSVADAAAVYISFTRDMAGLEGGFTDPEQIQAALRRGSAYDPGQISRDSSPTPRSSRSSRPSSSQASGRSPTIR